MEDTELRQVLDRLEKKLSDTYIAAEKTRRYILALVVISVVVLVLPLIGLVFAIPAFISTYSSLGAF